MSNARKHIDLVNRYVVDELVAETARNRYKQTDVASHLGISQGAVSERFRGKVAISAGEFVVWCDLLNLDPARVLDAALRRLSDPDLHALANAVRNAEEHPAVPPSRNALALAADGGHELPIGSENGEGFDD